MTRFVSTLALIAALLLCATNAFAEDVAEGLTSSVAGGVVTLKWPRVADAVWYNLYWRRTDDASTAEIKVVNVTSPYEQTGLVLGATYSYRITAGYAEGERNTGFTATATLAPSAPQIIDVVGGARAATLQWDPVPGALHYRVYWNTTGDVSASDTGATASQARYVHKDLQPGAHYYYRVAAQNAGGEGELSREVSLQLAGDAPTITAVKGNDTEARISWNNTPSAVTYNLYWSTNPGVTAQDNKIEFVTSTFIHTGLTRGATYYYRISAVNAGGESDLSAEVAAVLPPTAPAAFLHSDTEHATLEWPPVFGATAYHLYWDDHPGVSQSSRRIADVKPPYMPRDVKPGVTYYFRVAAANDGGESLSNEFAVALRPSMPVIARAQTASQTVILQWDPVVGANRYTLYWNTSGQVGPNDKQITGIAPPYEHTGLINGMAYHYRVAAQNVAGESALSPEFVVALPPDVPKLSSAAAGDHRVNIKWNETPGATEYAIYWNVTGNVTTADRRIVVALAQLEHGPLDSGATYYYRIAATNAGGASGLSPQFAVTLAPDAPKAEIAEVAADRITLRWSAVAGTKNYNVYWNTRGNVSVADNRLANVRAPFVHDKLKKGETYYYLVTAANDGGETSGQPLQATLAPDTPELPGANGGNKRIALSWKVVNGATAYRVFWNTTGNVTAKDAQLDVTASNMLHEPLANGATYFYRIAASNAGGNSPLSNEIKVTLAPDPPVITQVTGGEKRVTLSWQPIAGATAYNVYWNTTGNVATTDRKIAGATAPFVHDGIANGLTYHYLVAAVNAGGETISVPTRVTLIPDSPVFHGVGGGDKQTTLQWDAVPGATSYALYWHAAGETGEHDQVIETVTSPYTHAALANGGTYYYRVVARNEAGTSPFSKQSVITLAPDAPALVTSKGGDRVVNLKWTPMFGATSYRVYWNTTGDVSNKAAMLATKDAELAHDHLKRGMTYYYRIAAVNAGGEGLAAQFSVTLFPDATVISSIKGEDKQITLAWKTVGGATSYHIYWNNHGNVTTTDALLATGASTLLHGPIKNGAKYFYRIAASNAGGESELSPEVALTLAPDAPVINVATFDDKRVTIGWDAVDGAVSYNIYWKLAEGRAAKATQVLNATAPYVFTGLRNGTKYAYMVTAVNAGGEGYASEQTVVTPHNRKLFGLFPDDALQKCINSEAAANGWTYGDEVAGILVCNDIGVANISGVEWLENVTNLSLRGNRITDLSLLSGLVGLNYLALDRNNISNIAPLQSLTNLNYVSLSGNPISDVAALGGLNALTSVYLNETKLSDLSPLARLSSLVYLSVDNSEIVDVRPVAALRNLTKLYLSGNRIVDVLSLAGMTGLTELDISRNELGGHGVSNVDALVSLKFARALQLYGNTSLSCTDVTALIGRLGSPPVDLDGVPTNADVPIDGENCVSP